MKPSDVALGVAHQTAFTSSVDPVISVAAILYGPPAVSQSRDYSAWADACPMVRQSPSCFQLCTALYRGGGGEFCTGIFPQGKIPHGENSAPVPKNQGENSAPPKSSVHWKHKGSWDCDPQKTHTTTKQPSMILQMSDLSKSTTHVLFALP